MKKEDTKKLLYALKILLFTAYLALLCYFLFFAESMGRSFVERAYHYNLMPFKEIGRFWIHRQALGFWSVALNLVGNVVAFIPFGMFLPWLYGRCRKFSLTVLFSFEFSLFVEITQLAFKVGSFDVDDILLNTLGGVLGFLGYRIYVCIRKRMPRSGI